MDHAGLDAAAQEATIMTMGIRACAGPVAAAVLVFAAGLHATGAMVRKVDPNTAGPAKLICASPYGGKGIDEIVGAGVLTDGSIVLAGNANLTELKKGKGRGFLLRLTAAGGSVKADKPISLSGHIRRMKIDPAGNICVLVEDAGVYLLRPGRSRPDRRCAARGVEDFGVDADGEIVVLANAQMARFDRTWQRRKWAVSWHTYGNNVPGGMAVCPKTGVAVVVGYGMTHTGREPWKDPYAYGFSRGGKQLWKLWDPDPRKQVAASHGGNGLMADTTGKVARAWGDGQILLSLYADGGNSVCTRSPADPDQPIGPEVYEGVFQAGPGHGFKGASKTSVAFRADAATGKLERGTWMCAWISPQRANGLGIEDAAADETGRVYLVGGSASGCPTKDPWFHDTTGYQGGGFLGILDADFRMLQCGFFQQTDVRCVAARCGYVVIAGLAQFNPKDPNHPLQVHQPLQDDLGGGEADGYFAIFETGPHGAPAPGVETPRPAPEGAAARLLAEAKQAVADGKAPAARVKLRYLLSGYPGSPEAAEAKALLAQLAPDAAPKPAAESSERQAEKLLQRAENYLRNNLKPQARKLLEQLLREHPNTPAARHARKLLDEQFPQEQ
jgi:hypothetical protein